MRSGATDADTPVIVIGHRDAVTRPAQILPQVLPRLAVDFQIVRLPSAAVFSREDAVSRNGLSELSVVRFDLLELLFQRRSARSYFDGLGGKLELPLAVGLIEEELEVVVVVADDELAVIVHVRSTSRVVHARLRTGVQRVVVDMEAADRRVERNQVVDVDLLRRDRVGGDDAAVERIVLSLFSCYRLAAHVQLVVQAVIAEHDQLVGFDRVALDEVAGDGDAHEVARDVAFAHDQVADDAGFGEQLLDRSHSDVREVDVRVLQIRFFGGELPGVELQNIRLDRGELARRQLLELAVIRLKVVDVGVGGLEIGDRGVLDVGRLGGEHVRLELVDLSLGRLKLRDGSLVGSEVGDVGLGGGEAVLDREGLRHEIVDAR